MKKAFTLSEMLVCIAIMAALVVMFMSTIKARPNSNMVMFRKAYNITSNTVYEMLQSAAYYEDGLLSNKSATSQEVDGAHPSGVTKFCKIFGSYLNTAGEVKCTGGSSSKPSFTTLDGIEWYLPPKTTSGSFTGKETIRVDVNGKDNPPNCKESDADCKTPDIFEIYITKVGKISVTGDLAIKYLQNTKNISK